MSSILAAAWVAYLRSPKGKKEMIRDRDARTIHIPVHGGPLYREVRYTPPDSEWLMEFYYHFERHGA